jgi:hypothetical protein
LRIYCPKIEAETECDCTDKCKELEDQIKFDTEFFNSVSCLIVEGSEFMNKVEMYEAIRAEWQKALNKKGASND